MEVDKPSVIMSFFPSAWLPSSMVEQLTLNQLVRGSSPRGATNFLSECRLAAPVLLQLGVTNAVLLAGVAQW
jgi:hypothetical protein